MEFSEPRYEVTLGSLACFIDYSLKKRIGVGLADIFGKSISHETKEQRIVRYVQYSDSQIVIPLIMCKRDRFIQGIRFCRLNEQLRSILTDLINTSISN